MTLGKRGARGQATVELALVLPLILTMVLLALQIGLLARDQVLVVHAAREGARAAATDPSTATAHKTRRDVPGPAFRKVPSGTADHDSALATVRSW